MGHSHHHDEIIPPKRLELPKNFVTAGIACAAIGLVAFGVGLAVNPVAAWKGYIIGFWFTMSLALSGPFFVSTQHLVAAGWSSSIRRIPEAFGAFIYVAALLGIVGAFMAPDSIYLWQMDGANKDPMLAKKLGFLNKNWFIITNVLAFGSWAGLYSWMRKTSLEQDEKGDFAISLKLKMISSLFLITFVTGFSFLSWYWLMSLEPNWFSTMFSVYTFTGLFQSGLALTYVLMIKLGEKGYFGSFVGGRQVHDLGKLVFGFTTFYAYIGFSQFLLIWYANIPEEGVWYIVRLENGWAVFTLALPILKFIVPFLIMLPQKIKKNVNGVMVYICVWLICMQAYEVWYWVAPEPHGIAISGAHGGGPGAGPRLPIFELPILLGFVGLFAVVVGRALAAHNLVPIKDPFLHEALPAHTHEPLLMDHHE
jgi:hypothetical protein